MAAAATPTQLFRPSFFFSCYHLRRYHLGFQTTNARAAAVFVNNGRKTMSLLARVSRTRCYCSEQAANSAGTTSLALDYNANAKEVVSSADPERLATEAGNTLDIRVGRIIKVWRHEEADSLYVEEVDVGEPEPRTICSGLVNYIPTHLIQDKNVIVLANLKPRNMRGVKSNGMLMAASDATHENVELLVPPEGSVPGERVWFGSVDDKDNLPEVATPNQVQKKKIWELVQPHLRTDSSCVAMLGEHEMRTSAGTVICGSLKNAKIS